MVNCSSFQSFAFTENSTPPGVMQFIYSCTTPVTQTINFSLSNYKVAIRSSGTDAVVNTELKLQSGNKSSVGNGASPDIIQASIEAFEEAYNGLLIG